MKTIIVICICSFSMVACKSKQNGKNQNPQNDSTVLLPYAARYAYDFSKGNPEYLQMVLAFWKEYETGNIKKTAENFADTIRMVFPDASFYGPRDTVLGSYKKLRDKYSIVQCHLDAWMPARTNGQDNWVFIWGWQERTEKNGKLDAPVLHEVWRFNKKGKIDFMQQYQTRYVRNIFPDK